MLKQVKQITIRSFSGATWVLGTSFILLLLSSGQLLYRATLPTDGWAVYTTEIEPADWVYDSNLVGAYSDLQSEDILFEVDDVSVHGTASNDNLDPPPRWQTGESVLYHVQRNGSFVDVPVPVVTWTLAAFWRYNFGYLSKFASNVGFLMFLGLGWFTFYRRPELLSARALLVFSSAVGATFISKMLPEGTSVQFNAAAFYLTAFYSYIIFGVLLAPALLAFTLLFPNPKRVIQRHPRLILIPVLLGLVVLIAVTVIDIPELGWLGTLGMFIASLISLIHSAVTQRDGVSRAQMRWVLGGFFLGLTLFSLNFPLGFGLITDQFIIELAYALANLGFVVIGCAMAIAVLRYHLFDIDVIIRKTLVYAILSIMLALVYFGSVILLQAMFEALSGQQSAISIVISTLIIAALFAPLRNRIQNVIDRSFFRRRYDAKQVLAQFAQVVRDETDKDMLTAELVRVVQETMHPEAVNLWLKSEVNRQDVLKGVRNENNR